MQIDSTFIIFSPIRSDKYTIQSYYTYSTSAKKKKCCLPSQRSCELKTSGIFCLWTIICQHCSWLSQWSTEHHLMIWRDKGGVMQSLGLMHTGTPEFIISKCKISHLGSINNCLLGHLFLLVVTIGCRTPFSLNTTKLTVPKLKFGVNVKPLKKYYMHFYALRNALYTQINAGLIVPV